jgi:transketolase
MRNIWEQKKGPDITPSRRLKKMREQILQAAFLAKEGHIPSAFSILEILFVIYVLIPEEKNLIPLEDFDFVLSKGHGSLGLYAVLNSAGLIDDKWIEDFCRKGSRFGGHPDKTKIPGVAASTGSLGHGLPFAIGRILANRNLGIIKRSYCLLGDGELNEGSNWESFLLAESLGLSELCAVVDFNNSTTRAIPVIDLEGKLRSFGFEVVQVDGHDIYELKKVFSKQIGTKPLAVIANTIKGKGISAMENSFAWHHKSPSSKELSDFLEELIN